MKLITYSRVGYNHPSQANWSYWIWKVDFIDTEANYVMSHTVKENFWGECRFRDMVKPHGICIESKSIYTSTGTPKITGIASLLNIEDQGFIQQAIDFLTK